MWSAIRKTLKCVVTLCYNPCHNTPTAFTVANDRKNSATALYRKGEYEKKRKFCKLVTILNLSLELYGGGSGSIVTWAVAAQCHNKPLTF
jgi:hypothetical protein